MDAAVCGWPGPRLLDDDEPPAVNLYARDGGPACLLTCDHAGRRVPRRLGDLGLESHHFDRHIAWDIGAEGVAMELSRRLDATLVTQTYSRLVVDCNRPLEAHDLVAVRSEETEIPGNQGLVANERETRIAEIHTPYHDTIAALLEQRTSTGRVSVLVAVHSFTPVYRGVSRPWHVGLLYNRDRRLAALLHDLLAAEGDLVVGDNEPYRLGDETDFTVPVHGERRGIPHIEIEIRQDLIAEPDGQLEWAERWAHVLTQAVARLEDVVDAESSPR